MNIEIFTIAKFVELAQGASGPITLVGAGVNGISLPQFPAVVGFHVFALIRFERTEMGEHEVGFAVLDEDGKISTQNKITFTAAIDEGKDPARGYRQNMHMQGIPLPTPGRYRIDLLVDRAVAASVSLDVKQDEPKQPPAEE